MKAILINPFAKTVIEIEHDGSDYRNIYSAIDCACFTVIRISRTEVIFVDDEGLIVDKPQAFFSFKGYPQPIAGRGLILGEDGEGECAATKLTLDEVKARVSFPAVEVAGWTRVETGTENGPFGETFVIRGPTPVFEPTNPTEASKERH
jgi:hypothetical protein